MKTLTKKNTIIVTSIILFTVLLLTKLQFSKIDLSSDTPTQVLPTQKLASKTRLLLATNLKAGVHDKKDLEAWIKSTLIKHLKLSNEHSFIILSYNQVKNHTHTFRIQQTFKDIPVEQLLGTISISNSSSEMLYRGRHQSIDKNIDTKPQLSFESATKNISLYRLIDNEVVIWMLDSNTPLLTYKVNGHFANEEENNFKKVFVNAHNGRIVYQELAEHNAIHRKAGDWVATCQKYNDGSALTIAETMALEGLAVREFGRSETRGQLTTPGASKVFDIIGRYSAFLKSELGLNGLDGAGSEVYLIIGARYLDSPHPAPQCRGSEDNATWRGMLQTAYIPLSMKDAPEVIGHELGHGIVSNHAGLSGARETAALNESVSDVFGFTFMQWLDSGGWSSDTVAEIRPPSGDWVMTLPNGKIIRNISDPSNRYPSHYSEKVGSHHADSVITSHAFYLLANGGNHFRHGGTSVEGIGLRKAFKIYATAVLSQLTSHDSFEDARYAFADASELLYGTNSKEMIAVHNAMNAVGIPGYFTAPPIVSTPKPIPPQAPAPSSSPAKTSTSPQTKSNDPTIKLKQAPKKQNNQKKEPLISEPKKENTQYSFQVSKFLLIFLSLGALILVLTIMARRNSVSNVNLYQVSQNHRPARDSLGSHASALSPRHKVNNALQQITQLVSKLTLGKKVMLVTLESLGAQHDLRLRIDTKIKTFSVIGRLDELVDAVVAELDISKRHCRISLEDNQLFIEDLNSSAGTWINNKGPLPYSKVLLKQSDVIEIGSHKYKLRFDSSPS